MKQRLHQDSFREAVITAYRGRCALSGLREHRLLDAAHIVSDKDEPLGQPVVPNRLPLSKIHHTAFDADLIDIDPDYRVHVSERLLAQRDGPMLEALKQLQGGALHLPSRVGDRPDRERLERRFVRFKAQGRGLTRRPFSRASVPPAPPSSGALGRFFGASSSSLQILRVAAIRVVRAAEEAAVVASHPPQTGHPLIAPLYLFAHALGIPWTLARALRLARSA